MDADWQLPLAVLGLVGLTLFLTALVGRYQAHMADVRAALRRQYAQIGVLQGALTALGDVALAREMRIFLWREVEGRGQIIRRMHPAATGISALIADAGHQAEVQGPVAAVSVPAVPDEVALKRVLMHMDALAEYLDARRFVAKTVPGGLDNWRIELGERRAEVLTRYHLVAAERFYADGNRRDARSHLNHLVTVLRQRGPNTDFVRALYAEAETQLHTVLGLSIEVS